MLIDISAWHCRKGGAFPRKHIWDLSDLKPRDGLERKGDEYVYRDGSFTNMA